MTANVFGLRLLAQPRVRLTVLVILAIVVLAFRAIQFATLTTEIQWGYDFSAYWAAAGHLLHGEPIYTAAQLAGPYTPQVQYLYLYPPPVAAAVMPLAALFPTDYRAAAWVWSGIGAVVLVWSVLALARSERLGERYPILAGRGRWLLVAAAFAFPPVIGELVLGNVHLLLLGLLTAAWLCVRRGGARGGLISGATVGVAAVVKVFPGAVLLWFLLTRRFRAAAWVAIGAGTFILITLPFTGIEPWTQFPSVLANLSAPSDTTDTLAPTVWLAPFLGFLGARVVVTAAGLGLLAWAANRAAGPSALRSGSSGDYPTGITNETSGPAPAPSTAAGRSFAIAVTVAVLVAPALYHHYLALLVLPFVLALGAGVPLRYLAPAYFLMWGGQQNAIGDLAWIVNRALPTIGALVLLVGLTLASPPAPRKGDVPIGDNRAEPHLGRYTRPRCSLPRRRGRTLSS